MRCGAHWPRRSKIGIRAVVVDAIDEQTADFDRRHGFEPSTGDGLTFMVPIASVRSQLVV
jgi:hypothetical protein